MRHNKASSARIYKRGCDVGELGLGRLDLEGTYAVLAKLT